jgi:hypothetical protein
VLENHALDLCNIITFVAPGYLGITSEFSTLNDYHEVNIPNFEETARITR